MYGTNDESMMILYLQRRWKEKLIKFDLYDVHVRLIQLQLYDKAFWTNNIIKHMFKNNTS
jgi:hypothetical protein